MKENDICFRCPVADKIVIYKRASEDLDFAMAIAILQGIGTEGLIEHFGKTAEQLEICCKAQILCRKYERKILP